MDLKLNLQTKWIIGYIVEKILPFLEILNNKTVFRKSPVCAVFNSKRENNCFVYVLFLKVYNIYQQF